MLRTSLSALRRVSIIVGQRKDSRWWDFPRAWDVRGAWDLLGSWDSRGGWDSLPLAGWEGHLDDFLLHQQMDSGHIFESKMQVFACPVS